MAYSRFDPACCCDTGTADDGLGTGTGTGTGTQTEIDCDGVAYRIPTVLYLTYSSVVDIFPGTCTNLVNDMNSLTFELEWQAPSGTFPNGRWWLVEGYTSGTCTLNVSLIVQAGGEFFNCLDLAGGCAFPPSGSSSYNYTGVGTTASLEPFYLEGFFGSSTCQGGNFVVTE